MGGGAEPVPTKNLPPLYVNGPVMRFRPAFLIILELLEAIPTEIFRGVLKYTPNIDWECPRHRFPFFSDFGTFGGIKSHFI
jgi:hypothetical protein